MKTCGLCKLEYEPMYGHTIQECNSELVDLVATLTADLDESQGLKVFLRLAINGGAVVSAASLTSAEVVIARGLGRVAVLGDGVGFAYIPRWWALRDLAAIATLTKERDEWEDAADLLAQRSHAAEADNARHLEAIETLRAHHRRIGAHPQRGSDHDKAEHSRHAAQASADALAATADYAKKADEVEG